MTNSSVYFHFRNGVWQRMKLGTPGASASGKPLGFLRVRHSHCTCEKPRVWQKTKQKPCGRAQMLLGKQNKKFIGTSQAPWKKERKSSASTLALGTEAKGRPLLGAHCSHMKNGLISRKYTRGGVLWRSMVFGLSVCFHATDKDIPKTGQFTKERGLIGLTVLCSWGSLTIMAEDMDYSRQRDRTYAGELFFLKLSDLVRLIHYHENSTGKTCLRDSITSHWVPPTICGNSR
uniref:Uncharacterized protein n=1 Tax=Macaca fascicularis TaxID=9541 RepID=A0A7N9CIL2_MACFA